MDNLRNGRMALWVVILGLMQFQAFAQLGAGISKKQLQKSRANAKKSLVEKKQAVIGNLSAIKFHQKGELSFLEFFFDRGDVKVAKFHVKDDKQIILDFKNVESTEKVLRSFDTSEFSGAIVMVRPYIRPNSVNDLRVAIQLRDNVRSILARGEKKIVLKIENRFGVFSKQEMDTGQDKEQKIRVGQGGKIHVPKSNSIEDILENLTYSGQKKYIGKRISFNVKDVSVEDILKMIAEASGFNIILTEEIKKLPPLSLNLTNVPWDQALDTILGLNKLVADKNGIILMITTLKKATEERRLELEARKINKKQAPLVTKIFPLSYASTESMIKILEGYLTPKRGKISADKRTNYLIVKDTPQTVEIVRKIIEVLDTQTPQVLIESKIVEVQEEYSKNLGLKSGLNFGYDPIGTKAGGIAVVGNTPSVAQDGGPGFTFSSAPATGTNLFGVSISRFSRLFNLNFALQLMESESKGKVISSPRVITANKNPAKITTEDTTNYLVETVVGSAIQRTYKPSTANLSLEVTPQVTNEGAIALKVDITKEQFIKNSIQTTSGTAAPPDKSARTISTNVLVDNGSTIVIGGIYSFQKTESHSGVPFLKDIPLVGWLFRTFYNPFTKKNELVIFITPRIINQEEAGLVDNT